MYDYLYNYRMALAFSAHRANAEWPIFPISGDDLSRFKAGIA